MRSLTESMGLFGPGSVMWRINRERIVLLAGPSAAVLQVAHPQVALGVARHSGFRRDSVGRLHRTLEAMYAVAFGTGQEVEHIRKSVGAMHSRVRGTGYSASDPGAQLWVMATLIMGSVEMFERFLEPLSPAEKQQFLEENGRTSEVFGLAPEHLPKTWNAFEAYYQGMLEGDELGSLPLCAEVANAVLKPESPAWMRGASPVFRALAAERIPSPLLQKLKIPFSKARQPLWAALDMLLPRIIPQLPAPLRFAKAYRRAARRS